MGDADGGEGGKPVAAAPVATADGTVESGGKAADPIDAVAQAATAVPSVPARV